MLLDIVAKPHTRGGTQPVNSTKEKFEVTTSNVAYLAALVSVSDEVRNKCHVRHTFADVMPDSPTFDSFVVDTHLKKSNQHQNTSSNSNSLHHPPNVLRSSEMSPPVNSQHLAAESGDKDEHLSSGDHQQENQPANTRPSFLVGPDSNDSSEVGISISSQNNQNSATSNKQTAMATVSSGGGLVSGFSNLQVGPRLEKRANSVACVSNSSSVTLNPAQTVNKSLSEDVPSYHKQNDEMEEESNYATINDGDAEDVPAANATIVNVGGASNSSAPTPRPSLSLIHI